MEDAFKSEFLKVNAKRSTLKKRKGFMKKEKQGFIIKKNKNLIFDLLSITLKQLFVKLEKDCPCFSLKIKRMFLLESNFMGKPK